MIPAEPQDAFNDFARVVADQQLGVVIEFPGRVDLARLESAVAEVIAAQPVLGCRFASEGRRAWHEPATDAGAVAVLDAGAGSQADAAAWDLAVAAAGQTLSPDAAHLAVVLVRGSASDVLAVRIDHTAADGQGVKACVELLAEAYNGTLSADPRAATTDRSWRRLRRSVGWWRLLSAAARRKGDPRPTWGLPRAGDATGRRRHDLLTLPPERFSAIRAWGKQRNRTVNDILLAAWYRVLFALLAPAEGEPMVLRVSFDQRRYLDAADPMPAASNLSSIEPLALARVAAEPFESTVARVAAEMDRLKASSPGLGSALLLELLYRAQGFRRTRAQMAEGMLRGQAVGRTYPFLSNFGVLAEQPLRFGDLQPSRVVILPVAAHPPFAMLGASSFGGELTLSLGFAEGEIDPTLAPRMLAEIEADLPRA